MLDSPWHINALERATNLAFSCLPSPVPPAEQLRNCKLVGHRGAHLGTPFIENTLEAFTALADAGVWGVEMDMRWTRDLVPVISHDPDCKRLFQNPLAIAASNFRQLRQQVPQVSSLEEVIAAFGGQLHLMIEIKAEYCPQSEIQARILQDLLSALSPAVDYHFLALDPALFSQVPFAPLASQVIVGILNMSEVSKWAQQTHYGGIAGAYPFFTRKLRHTHRRLGQRIGTGHIDSKRLLFQEIAKGTDWIFSNRVLKLQNLVNTLAAEGI